MASLPIPAGGPEEIGQELDGQFSREKLGRRPTPEPRPTNGYHPGGRIAIDGANAEQLTPHAVSQDELVRVSSQADGTISYEYPTAIVTVALPRA